MNGKLIIDHIKAAVADFKNAKGINRDTTDAQINKLTLSLQRKGCLRPVIVAYLPFIGPGLFMIDGQHLYEALKRLDWYVPYRIVTINDKQDLVETIALLNASSKSWCMKDYVLAWSSVVPAYEYLAMYHKRYGFEMGVTASIMMNQPVSSSAGGSAILQHVKKGNFKVNGLIRAKMECQYLTDVLKVIGRVDRQRDKYVCSEYINMLRANSSKYKHKRFLKNLETNKSLFTLSVQEPDRLSDAFKTLI